MHQNKKTLVIGASPKAERYSYKATQMLQEYNHEVVPFGVKKGAIGALHEVDPDLPPWMHLPLFF